MIMKISFLTVLRGKLIESYSVNKLTFFFFKLPHLYQTNNK